MVWLFQKAESNGHSRDATATRIWPVPIKRTLQVAATRSEKCKILAPVINAGQALSDPAAFKK